MSNSIRYIQEGGRSLLYFLGGNPMLQEKKYNFISKVGEKWEDKEDDLTALVYGLASFDLWDTKIGIKATEGAIQSLIQKAEKALDFLKFYGKENEIA